MTEKTCLERLAKAVLRQWKHDGEPDDWGPRVKELFETCKNLDEPLNPFNLGKGNNIYQPDDPN